MKLKIRNLKTIGNLELNFLEEKSIINLVGLNGSGKTNILKSISYFCDDKINLDNKKPVLVSNDLDINKWTKDKIDDIRTRIEDKSFILYENEFDELEDKKFQTFLNIIKNIDKNLWVEIKNIENLNKIEICKIEEDYYYLYNPISYSLTSLGAILLLISKYITEKYKENTIIQNTFSKLGLENVVKPEILKSYDQTFIFNFFSQNLLENINNKLGINEEQKKDLSNIVNFCNEILDFYNYQKIPQIVFIDNFSEKLSIQSHNYDLKILNDEKNEKYNSLVSFLKSVSEETYKEALWCANELKKDIALQNKRDIDRKFKWIKKYCENEYTKIFQKNDIYAEPKFEFNGSTLEILVSTKKRYLINIDDYTKENSDGYKAILSLIIELRKFIYEAKANPSKQFLILADEIEKNIHPMAQIKLINYIEEELLNIPNLKIVLSTHSLFLIKNSPNIQNFVVLRDEYGFSIVSTKEKISKEITADTIILDIHEALDQNKLYRAFMNENGILGSNLKENISLNNTELLLENYEKNIENDNN